MHVRTAPAPRQRNGFDCGAHCVATAEAIVAGSAQPGSTPAQAATTRLQLEKDVTQLAAQWAEERAVDGAPTDR